MNATYDLFHAATGARITFAPFKNIEGKAAVGIQTVCGGNWGTATRTPEEARAEWKAWIALGAVDLRKKLVFKGCVYNREADGTVSMSVVVDNFGPDFKPEKYAPEGYVFAHSTLGERDEYMSYHESSWRLYFKPSPGARFSHDCDRCKFLGAAMDENMRHHDIYLCASEDALIARYGSSGEEYRTVSLANAKAFPEVLWNAALKLYAKAA